LGFTAFFAQLPNIIAEGESETIEKRNTWLYKLLQQW
jgi:hypothetical protein